MVCFKVILTNSYEDGIKGVHLRNKLEQDQAMQGGDLMQQQIGRPFLCINFFPFLSLFGWYCCYFPKILPS
jgi:hypothetical protein